MERRGEASKEEEEANGGANFSWGGGRGMPIAGRGPNPHIVDDAEEAPSTAGGNQHQISGPASQFG